MYNEHLKQQFLETISQDSTRKFLRWIFCALEKQETMLDRDVSQMSQEVLQSTINSISGMRRKNTESMIYNLKRYIDWLKKQGFPYSDAIDLIEVDTSAKIRERMVDSPSSLAKILDEVFDSSKLRTIDCTYRVCLWLAFAGLRPSAAIGVTEKNIDLKNRKILLAGFEPLEIYQEALLDFFYACDTEEFIEYKYRPSSLQVVEYHRSRAQGDSILRGKESKKPLDVYIATTVSQTIAKKFAAADERHKDDIPPYSRSLELSYDRVYMSGVFYLMLQRERAGLVVDFENRAQAEYEEKELQGKYKSDKKGAKRKTIRRKALEYEKDYKLWKSAFDLS